MMTPVHRQIVARVIAAVACLNVSLIACAQDRIEFNRDIRPIMLDTCFQCHGPDSAARKADLRLDKREAAIERSALVPGQPTESEIIRRILSDNPEEIMPPPELKKPLTDAQKKTLTDWVAQGGEYQQHWSYLAPVKADVPSVPAALTATHANWPSNPIDNFILQKLSQHGLTPAPEADRRSLARRVALDLIGIPPEPELVDAFVAFNRDPA